MLPNLFRRARSRVRSTAVLAAVVLAVGALLPAQASAAPSSTQSTVTTYTPPVSDAIETLRHYGIVVGDETGNLQLYNNISRAEMVTILVRLLGKEGEAQQRYGSTAFTDTGRHWASGYVAVAQQQGLANGYPDGSFRPDNPVTYAEAMALLLRTVGKSTTGPWPSAVINEAVSLGIEPPDVSLSSVANTAALRLHVFQSLFLAGTRITLPSSGKTAFQTYIDTTPPNLYVTPLPSTTTSDSVIIQGSASDAVAVYVNGVQAPLAANGTFQRTVSLVPGLNTFAIYAFDRVGNRTIESVATTYATGAARIEVDGPTTVKAGSDVKYNVQVFDKNGINVGARDVSVKVVGNIGQYDLETHTLHVGNTSTTGKLIFSVGSLSKEISVTVQGLATGAESLRFANISEKSVLSINQNHQIRIDVLDKNGNVLTSDNGREITLRASGDPDVDITPTTITTIQGKAYFTIRSDEDGPVTLRASAEGLDDVEVTINFATDYRILLRANPEWLPPDGESEAEITAVLVDKYNYPVKNRDEDIEIELDVSGRGDLDDDTVTIEKGDSESERDTGVVVADDREGTITVTGRVVDGPKYTVVPLTIPVEEPEAAEDMQLRITGPSSADVGDEVTYTVEIRDKYGYLVTSGSYAFQIAIKTSNKEYDEDGIPKDMEVYLGDTTLNPVDDGYAEGSSRDGDDVIARTVNGKATIKVRYNVSGEVTITPVPKGYTAEAYDSKGYEGAAASTKEIDEDNITSVTTSFYDDPAFIRLEVDSDLGKGQPGGAVRSGRSTTVTIRALVVDDNGTWVPGVNDYTVELAYDFLGSASQKDLKNNVKIDDDSIKLTNGKAEFKVQFGSGAPVGTYEFYATARKGSWLWNRKSLGEYASVPIDVEKNAPELKDDNIIVDIRGYRDGKLGSSYIVGTEDEGMAIVLNSKLLNNERAAKVRVYEEGKRSEIFTSDVVDFDPNASEPVVIYVPRDVLDDGEAYEVRIENSRGLSDRSAPSEEVSVVSGYSRATLSSAEFTGKKSGNYYVLEVTTSRTSCSGEIDPDKLLIVAGSQKIYPDRVDFGKDVNSSCRAFNILLSEQQLKNLLSQADKNPRLEVEDGWYYEKGGKSAEAAEVKITGLVSINRAIVDWAANKLIIEGTGLKKTDLGKSNTYKTGYSKVYIYPGSLKAQPIQLQDEHVVSQNATLSDTQWVLPLETAGGKTQLKEDMKAKGKQSTWIVVIKDWYGDWPDATVTLQSPAVVTGAEYNARTDTLTLKGSGFDPTGSLDLTQMRVKTWNNKDTATVGGTVQTDKCTTTRIVITVSKGAADLIENNNYVYFYGLNGWLKDEVGIYAAPTGDLLITQ